MKHLSLTLHCLINEKEERNELGERLEGRMRKIWTESCIMNFRHMAVIRSEDELSVVCVGLYSGMGQYEGNVRCPLSLILSLLLFSPFLLYLIAPFSLVSPSTIQPRMRKS